MRIHAIAALGASIGLLAHDARAQDTTAFEKPVRIEADGAFIDTGKDIGYAGPLLVDWNGDGKQDLLVSAFRGNIRYFENVGTAREPAFAEKEPLHAGGEPIRIHNW